MLDNTEIQSLQHIHAELYFCLLGMPNFVNFGNFLFFSKKFPKFTSPAQDTP